MRATLPPKEGAVYLAVSRDDEIERMALHPLDDEQEGRGPWLTFRVVWRFVAESNPSPWLYSCRGTDVHWVHNPDYFAGGPPPGVTVGGGSDAEALAWLMEGEQ